MSENRGLPNFVERSLWGSLWSIPRTVWGLAIATFLMNASTIIIFSFSPLYLTVAFGVTAMGIGMIEAVVECISWLMRVVSGVLSDFFRKRKLFILISYSLAALARPIFPLATSPLWIFVGRTIDRIANGLQATPREALIADLSPPGLKGACFGLRQALGTAGSAFGAFVGVVIMAKTNNYQLVFWVATIPALLAVALLVFMMEDNRFTAENMKPKPPKGHLKSLLDFSALKEFPFAFWIVVAITMIILLGRFSGAFLIMFASHMGMEDCYAPTVMIVFNVLSALSAYPLGVLSDKFNRKFALGIGFVMILAADLVLAFAPNVFWVYVGVVLWGVQFGITQSIPMAMVADVAPKHLRGTAFGIFYLANGIALFFANAIAGVCSKAYGPHASFLASATIITLGLVVVYVVNRGRARGST